jgi:hypothetical protein
MTVARDDGAEGTDTLFLLNRKSNLYAAGALVSHIATSSSSMLLVAALVCALVCALALCAYEYAYGGVSPDELASVAFGAIEPSARLVRAALRWVRG